MLFKSWRSLTLLVVFVLLGLVTWLYVDAELNRRRGEGEYADAVAATELTDPGWRWEALAKVRTVTPSASNSAELILRIKALIPPNWGDSEEDKEGDANLPPRNRAWSDETIGAARKGLRDLGRAVELARGLKDLPHGDRSLELTPLVLPENLAEIHATRTVAQLLRLDAIVALADGKRDRTGDDLLALLNVSRSVGDEPFLSSQLVRMATRSVAARTLEDVLAQGELSESKLAALQEAWATDAEEPLLLYGVRGERAAYDVVFRNLADGSVDPADLHGLLPGEDSIFGGAMWLLYRRRIPRERAFYHQWMTKAVDAARLPVHEQPAAMKALPSPPAGDMPLAKRVLPAVEKIAAAHWRSVVEARCVVVALACERYRIKHDGWPERLEDLPRELLSAVPLDPYDGRPLRYRRFVDGVAVYSIGKDGDYKGVPKPQSTKGTPKDPGCRLWNPADRRVAP